MTASTLSAQAQGDEPVGEVGTMPGTDGFTMAVFRASDVPIGTKLYARLHPAGEAVAWLITFADSSVGVAYDNEEADGIIAEANPGATKQPLFAHPAPTAADTPRVGTIGHVSSDKSSLAAAFWINPAPDASPVRSPTNSFTTQIPVPTTPVAADTPKTSFADTFSAETVVMGHFFPAVADTGGLVERLQEELQRNDVLIEETARQFNRAEAAEQRVVELTAERDELREELKRAEERHRVGLRLAFSDSAAEAQMRAMREALEPFADLDMPAADKWTCGTFLIEHADIRRARAALAPVTTPPAETGDAT